MTTDKRQHRKLTERERDRMIDIYASGPLTYIKKIDDALFELGLIEFYDQDVPLNEKAVVAKYGERYFYAKNGSVLPEWYSSGQLRPVELSEASSEQLLITLYSMLHELNGGDFEKRFNEIKKARGRRRIYDTFDRLDPACMQLLIETLAPFIDTKKSKEQTWECYTLSKEDLIAVAERKGLSLDRVDLEDVISSIKKGIEWALDNRDEIIEDAIRGAGGVIFEED